jgi:ABC-type tungstate transport system substrate-binding protein
MTPEPGPLGIAAVAARSLLLSGTSTALALAAGVPAGVMLARSRGRLGALALSAANAGMALPPVLVGLVVALGLWRSGPLGGLGWMYTPAAIVVAQTLLALPIAIALSASAIRSLDPELAIQIDALGPRPARRMLMLLREATPGVFAAGFAAFGAAISEVGAVMMTGGNIEGETRVLTTAILQETRMGNFEAALGLGAVLLGLSLVIAALATRFQAAR